MIVQRVSDRPVGRIAGRILAVLGFFHFLYYVLGMGFGWEIDVWNIVQAIAGLVAVAVGLGIARYNRRYLSYRAKRLIVTAAIPIALILGLFIFVEGNIVWSALQAHEDRPADYVLILGARVRGDQPSLTLQSRLDTGLEYALRHPESTIVASGGQGSGESVSEAEAMKRYLVERGIPSERILKEEQSTNTFENFQYSQTLLRSRTDFNGKELLVVTSDFHMYRSLMLAERIGLQAQGLAASTPGFTIPKSYMREFAAVIKSYLFDK